MVANAIEFLQDSRVVSSPEEKKRRLLPTLRFLQSQVFVQQRDD